MPILFARLHDTSVRSDKASIVERVVQATILTNCATDHLLNVGQLGHIDANVDCFSAVVANGSNGLFRSSVINISDYHPRALSRKGHSGRAPDAGAPPVTTTTLPAVRFPIPNYLPT